MEEVLITERQAEMESEVKMEIDTSKIQNQNSNSHTTNEVKKVSCAHCKIVFKTFYQFYKHKHRKVPCHKSLTIKDTSWKRICSRCKKTFTDFNNFKKHLVGCYLEQKPSHTAIKTTKEIFTTDFTPEKQPKMPYKPKRKTAPTKNCDKCGIRFRSMGHYTLHLRKKNACRAPPYICRRCNKVFGSTHNLLTHEKRKNSCTRYLSNLKPFGAGDQLTVEQNDPKPKECSIKICLQSSAMKKESSDKNESSKSEDKNSNTLPKPRSRRKSGILQCKSCLKVFPYMYRLKSHLSRKTSCVTGQRIDSSPAAAEPAKTEVKRSARKIFPPVRFEPDLSDFSLLEYSSSQLQQPLKNSARKSFSSPPVVKKSPKIIEEVSDVGSTSSMSHLVCDECDRTFPSTSSWYKHGRKYHYDPSMRPIKCPDCNVVFQSKYLLRGHQKKTQHWGKEHCRCPFCQKQFTSYKIRNSHVRTSHKPSKSNTVEEFLLVRTCQLCSKDFMDLEAKKFHMRMEHKDVTCVLSSAENSTKCAEGKPDRVVCSKCKLVFSTKQLFLDHFSSCTSKKNKSSSLLIQSKAGGVSPTIFICNNCGMNFTTKHHYSAHQNRFCPKKNGANVPVKTTKRGRGILSIENGKFMFVCSLCKMKFNSRFQYSIHARRFCPMKNKRAGLKLIFQPLAIKAKENELEKNPCPSTGKIRAKKRKHIEKSLPKVMNRAHVMEIPLQHSLKEKQPEVFEEQWRLALEKQKSPVAKKYFPTCEKCSIRFASIQDYREHNCEEINDDSSKEMENSSYTEEPFKLPLMRKTKKFYVKSVNKPSIITSSISHLMKKYPMMCPFCRRRYCNSYVRDRHLKLHTLDRSFNCEFCNESYLRSEYLTRHMQARHHHLLKYECARCGLRYLTKVHCNHHINKMHKTSSKTDIIAVKESSENDVIPDASSEPTDDLNKPIKKLVNRANQPLPSNILRVGKNAPGRGIFSCELCQVGNFAKMSTLQRHLKSRLHRENVLRRRLRTVRNKQSNDDLVDNRTIICSLCHQSCTGIKIFVPHRLSHFNNKNTDPTEINEANPYSCEICAREFSHHQRVQAHLLWHLRAIKTSRFAGTVKGITNASDSLGLDKQLLSDSVNVSPNKEGPAKKSIGGGSPTKAPKRNFNHRLPDVDQSIDCSSCNASFTNLQQYQNHACIKSVRCAGCGLSFANSRGLGVHRSKWCSNENVGNTTKQSENDPKNSISEVMKSRDCSSCGNSFEDVHQYEKHACTRGLVCTNCGLSFANRRGLSVHRAKWCKKISLQSVLFTCRYCSLEFNSSDDVGWHEKSCQKVHLLKNASFDQNGQKPFSCKYCKKIVHSYSLLLQHEQNCKSKENLLHAVHCLICQKKLCNSQAIEAHINFHPGQKVRMCCLKCIKHMDSVEEACQHIGQQKVQENSVCDPVNDNVSDNFSGSLKEEMVSDIPGWDSKTSSMDVDSSLDPETFVVHSPKLGKLYQCIHCRKLYRDKFHLKAHLVIHKPFVCQVCGQMECTAQGYQSHPCRLPNGSFATGILHRKKHLDSTDINAEQVQNSVSVQSTPTTDILCKMAESSEKTDVPGGHATSLVCDNEEALNSLRENFSQLLFILVSDPELMTSLGWGKKVVDLVLDDVLLHLGQPPVKVDKIASDMERLRENILLFLQLCIKDDVLNSMGSRAKPIDEVVRGMLQVCTDGLEENLPNGTTTTNTVVTETHAVKF